MSEEKLPIILDCSVCMVGSHIVYDWGQGHTECDRLWIVLDGQITIGCSHSIIIVDDGEQMNESTTEGVRK